MKVNVIFSPQVVDELYFNDKVTIVIDVLRATTVIIEALTNGAKEIIPVASIDFAIKISGSSSERMTLLCGERNTKIIDGFNLGNSPYEYNRDSVEGKSLVLFTTNGTKAIVKAKYSSKLFIAAFTNLNAVINEILQENQIEILCAGSNGIFSLEDSVCAGNIVSLISSQVGEIELNDSARAAYLLYENYKNNIYEMLKLSEHGQNLINNDFSSDLEFCSRINSTTSVPQFVNGSIKIV